MSLDERAWHDEAKAHYLKAAAADPSWAAPLFNLGLLAKRERRWLESLSYNQAALERQPTHEGALWNAGIAATAVGNWSVAREAWRSYGIDIPDGDGPPDLDLGIVPIRCDGEVLWSHRIDPARAIILSVPFPESERRYRDLVLHDGAPNGSRWYKGREVSVFDELELLQKSDYQAFSFLGRVDSPDHVRRLGELAAEAGLGAEDWTTVEFLCEACSKGLSHKHHLREASPWESKRHLAIAAKDERSAKAVLDRWCELTGAVLLEEPVDSDSR